MYIYSHLINIKTMHYFCIYAKYVIIHIYDQWIKLFYQVNDAC